MTEDKRIYPINACQWQSTPCGIFWQCIQWKYYRHNIIWTPHISTLPLWTVTVWSTLQSSEHQNDQTQKQFLSPSNASHEHVTLNVEHTTLLYIIYSSHILIFISICTFHTCTYIIVYCVFDILYIIILLSVSCPVAVILLHCGASVTKSNSLYA